MKRAAVEVFTKTSFWEKLYVLLIAAIVSAVFALLVVDPIGQRVAERREHEAALVQARIELHDNLTTMFWMLHARTWNLTFYAARTLRDGEAYQRALDSYQAETASAQGAVRAEIGKAQRLISREVYGRLLEFYANDLLELDRIVERLIIDDARSDTVDPAVASRWVAAHESLRERVSESLPLKITTILCDLAIDLGIAEDESACVASRAASTSDVGRHHDVSDSVGMLRGACGAVSLDEPQRALEFHSEIGHVPTTRQHPGVELGAGQRPRASHG